MMDSTNGNHVPNHPGRFSYVTYDESAKARQEAFKGAFEAIDVMLLTALPPSPEKTLAVRKLEEAYMWVGKAIRDDQVRRNGGAEHQPARGDE